MTATVPPPSHAARDPNYFLGMALVVLAIRNRGGLLGAFRAAGIPAVVAGLCLSIAFSGFIFSLGYTTVANTLFLLAASPLLAAVLGLARHRRDAEPGDPAGLRCWRPPNGAV